MRRLAFAAVPFVFLLLAGSCGGSNSDDKAATTTATEPSPTPNSNEQPSVPDKPLPTPTVVDDGSPVFQVVYSGKTYAPTRSEFAALPKVTLSTGGHDYQGVSLSVLAEQVSPRSEANVTIQGTRLDNLRLGAIRFPLADIGATTVFVMDDAGHIALASSTVPPEQWLQHITGIAFS